MFSVEANTPHSPMQSNIRQGPRGRRRQQRHRISAAEARQRLVNVSETRAQAEITNSRTILRGVHVLDEMVTVLRNILAR